MDHDNQIYDQQPFGNWGFQIYSQPMISGFTI